MGRRRRLQLKKRAGKIGSDAHSRLKFVTILQSVVDPTIEKVEGAISNLAGGYGRIFGDMKLWSRGSIELEIVNLELLRRISKGSESEARKLKVLEAIREKKEFQGLLIPSDLNTTEILVHSHTVVDFGIDYERNIEEARRRREYYGLWKESGYQFEILGLYERQKTGSSLQKIAAYVTKAGNENLRYNANFGRDRAEDLEAMIWREGLGRADKGGETIEDERSLSVAEVKTLDGLYRWLMDRRSDKRGYLLTSSDR